MNASEINCDQVDLRNQKIQMPSQQNLDFSSMHQAIGNVASTSGKVDKQSPPEVMPQIRSKTNISKADLETIENINRLMKQCDDISASLDTYNRGPSEWERRKLSEIDRKQDSITDEIKHLRQKYGEDRINNLLTSKRLISQASVSEVIGSVTSITDQYSKGLSRSARRALKKRSKEMAISSELSIAAQIEKRSQLKKTDVSPADHLNQSMSSHH
jgi:hypothetical protein